MSITARIAAQSSGVTQRPHPERPVGVGVDAALDLEVHVLERRRPGHGGEHRHLPGHEGGDDAGEGGAVVDDEVQPAGVDVDRRARRRAPADVAERPGRRRAPPRSTSAGEARQQRGGELVGRAEGAQPAEVEHADAVGEPAGLAEEVGAEHDGAPVLGGERRR